MSEELENTPYLYLSSNRFGIYLYDKKENKNIFKCEIELQNKFEIIDVNEISNFVENNIFKIEKLIGKFVKNIILVIENNQISNLYLGIKKKNYDESISETKLKNILTEAKDLFKENYQDHSIMHMLIENYLINGKNYPSFTSDLECDQFSLEIRFIYFSDKFANEIDKVLHKFQIKVIKYMDGNYIRNFFPEEDLDLPEMIYRITMGNNANEVSLVSKNVKKSGFFERFFQLFS